MSEPLLLDLRNGQENFIFKKANDLLAALRDNDIDTAKNLLKQNERVSEVIVNVPCGILRVTSLQLAASKGTSGLGFMNLLLRHGARANVQDKLGRSPLHHACAVGCDEGARLLLNKGADVNVKYELVKSIHFDDIENTDCGNCDSKDIPSLPLPECWGRTPLHQAVKGGHPNCVEVLLKVGADPNVGDEKGITPLLLAGAGMSADDTASVKRYEEIVELLVNAGANVSVRNVDCDTTALHHAALLRSVRATELLLNAGINFLEYRGKVTALHEAASSGCVPVVKLLIKRGADVMINQPDQVGRTALHKAAYFGSRECLSLLIAAGGDLSLRTSTNVSVMDAIFSHVPRPINFITEILDKCIIPNSASVNDRSFKVQLDFGLLVPKGQQQQMAVVTAIICGASEHQKKTLLQHPLLQTYLHLKWNKLRIFFFLLLIIHAIFVISLSIYVAYQVHKKSTAYEVVISRRVLITSVTFILVYGLGQVAILPRHYLQQFETILNLLCAILALSVTVWGEIQDSSTSLRKTSWMLHVLSVVILLAWAQLMLLVGRFPTWGYYALMFYTVLKNVVKVLLTFGCLVIGFAFSFLIQFQDELQFSNVWLSIVKTTVMMMGEYEYGQLFEDSSKDNMINRLPVTSRIVFLIFVILASIVLMNLMVGLAVSDIQALQLEGHIRRLLKQADFIEHLEKITVLPFLRKSFLQHILYHWLYLRHKIPVRITLHPSETSLSDVNLPYNLLEMLVAVAIRNQHTFKVNNTKRDVLGSDENESTNDNEIVNLLKSLQLQISEIQEHLQITSVENEENTFSSTRPPSNFFPQAVSDVQAAQSVIQRLKLSNRQHRSTMNI